MNLLSTLLHLLPFSFSTPPQIPLHIDPVLLNSTFNMDSFLFPATHNYSEAWTTSSNIVNPNVRKVDLSNEALGVRRINARPPSCDVVPAPNVSSDNPQKAWRAFFPKGSINPKGEIPGGFGFYLGGPNFFEEQLQSAQEVIFGYSILFQEDWEWVKGGKLPGACRYPCISEDLSLQKNLQSAV